MTCIRVVYISSKHAHILHNHIYVYILYNCVCDSLCMLNSFSLPIIYLQIDVSIKNVMSHFFQEGKTHVPYFLNPSSNTASMTHLFNQTPSQLLWEASSHMLQLMYKGYLYTYPPLSIARYSFTQLSELEKIAQGFNISAQDSNPGSLSRQSEALPLSHCALHVSLAHYVHSSCLKYQFKNWTNQGSYICQL